MRSVGEDYAIDFVMKKIRWKEPGKCVQGFKVYSAVLGSALRLVLSLASTCRSATEYRGLAKTRICLIDGNYGVSSECRLVEHGELATSI